MANDDYNAELQRMQERLRTLRDLLCEQKNKNNPRYHAFSSAIAQLNRAIAALGA